MKTLITQVQLPDGTLMTIEGGNAADIATFLEAKLRTTPGQSQIHVTNARETQLLLPILSFSPSAKREDVITTNFEKGQIVPLGLPDFRF
jgi:hypothetical protein